MRFAGVLIGGCLLASAVIAQAQTVKDGVDAWQRGDYAAAVRSWRPLAQAGDGDAAFDLAQAYKLGRGVPVDLVQAKLLYGQAARAGHTQGAANYGLLLFQDGDRKAAMPWIQQAAEAGDPRAQYVYGTALFNGDLAGKDWPKAYALMTRAAAAGLPQATTSLSQMDQFISPGDRQKGLQMATTMASKPVPPIGRQVVTGGSGPTTTARGMSTVAAEPAVAAADAVYLNPNASDSAPPVPVRSARAAPVAKPAPMPRPAPAPRPVPVPRTAAPAPVAVASAGGRWMVQLGAYGSEAGARAAWGGIAGKLHGLSPSYQKAGAVVRLRATGLADRAAAERACAAAKPAACFPVAP